MKKKKRTEAISEYVLKRIDSQNSVVGAVLCILTVSMGFFFILLDGSDRPEGLSGFESPQAQNLLLMGAAVFAALIFILSRNDDRLSEGRRHLLSVIAIIIFDASTMAFGFFAAGADMANGRGMMNFAVSLLLVFGAIIYPFLLSLIAVPAISALFALHVHLFAGAMNIEPYHMPASEAMDLFVLTIIVTIISIMNSLLQKKRFEAEGVYFNNVKTLLAANPNAFSALRVNVTKDEVPENIGKGPIADALQGAGSIDEIIKRIVAMRPALSKNSGRARISRDSLLAAFDEGRDQLSFDWNYQLENGRYGWVNSNVRLIKNPTTKDIEAVVCSETNDRRYATRRILSILSDIEYIQIATIDVERKTISLYSSEGKINDGTFPDRDYDEETRSILQRFSSEYAGSSGLSARMLSFDTIIGMLSQKDVYQVRFQVGSKHYQECFRYLDEFKKNILMTVQDITELLSEEEEKNRRMREALSQARESSRMKGEFISRMSHDIRTPMSSIIGFSSLLERDKNDPERIASDTKNIMSAGNELLALVSDVLDIVKLNSRENGLIEKEFSLDRTVRRVAESANELSVRRAVGFSVDESGIAHENFIGDEERIGQILSNIIVFLLNRTKKGGNVSLFVKSRPHPSGKEENISFEIRGDQVVLSHEYQETIFEPFSKEEVSVEDRIDAEAEGNAGTGLALPISKTLTELMGGNIYVKSDQAEGTVFSVIIPLRFTEAELFSIDPGQTEEEKNVFDGLRILAAEDNELNAVLLREIMAMKGAETEVRGDGEQVLSAFKYSPAGKYDVILMDVQMPVMDGHEAARAIRALESDMSLPLEKRRESSIIPIIAMTANTFPEDVEESLNSGMNDHVGKPIDIVALSDAIRKSLPKA